MTSHVTAVAETRKAGVNRVASAASVGGAPCSCARRQAPGAEQCQQRRKQESQVECDLGLPEKRAHGRDEVRREGRIPDHLVHRYPAPVRPAHLGPVEVERLAPDLITRPDEQGIVRTEGTIQERQQAHEGENRHEQCGAATLASARQRRLIAIGLSSRLLHRHSSVLPSCRRSRRGSGASGNRRQGQRIIAQRASQIEPRRDRGRTEPVGLDPSLHLLR
jgi:hypothetical protein